MICAPKAQSENRFALDAAWRTRAHSLGKVGILFLLVRSLRTAAKHQTGEVVEEVRHRLTEIGLGSRPAASPIPSERFTEQARPVDVAVLDEQDLSCSS